MPYQDERIQDFLAEHFGREDVEVFLEDPGYYDPTNPERRGLRPAGWWFWNGQTHQHERKHLADLLTVLGSPASVRAYVALLLKVAVPYYR